MACARNLGDTHHRSEEDLLLLPLPLHFQQHACFVNV
jgi:hypothetical protein